MSVPLCTLMATHSAALPVAQTPTTAPASISSTWQRIHVLAEGCPCSAAVANILAERGPAGDVSDIVYVSGDEQALEHLLAGRGFTVRRLAPEQLFAEVGVRGGPWLVIRNPQRQIAYSGGYASTRPRRGTELQDSVILARLQAGQSVDPLPAFGCAIDPDLKREMDPLRLKY